LPAEGGAGFADSAAKYQLSTATYYKFMNYLISLILQKGLPHQQNRKCEQRSPQRTAMMIIAYQCDFIKEGAGHSGRRSAPTLENAGVRDMA
jgi:hypothetical protein